MQRNKKGIICGAVQSSSKIRLSYKHKVRGLANPGRGYRDKIITETDENV